MRSGAGRSNRRRDKEFALRSVARRYLGLSEEIADLEGHIERLVRETSPSLMALVEGVGSDTAAISSDRRRGQPRSTAQRGCFRPPLRGGAHTGFLGQGGPPSPQPSWQPRGQPSALYVVALNRLRRDLRTQAYLAKRTAEGKSKREISCGA